MQLVSPQSIVITIIANGASQVKNSMLNISLYRDKTPSEMTGGACVGITQKIIRRSRMILRLLCSNNWASALSGLPSLFLSKAFIL